MNSRKRVFVSYSFEDKKIVDQIIQRLLLNGIEVYYESNLTSDIREELKYKIEASETVLLILSNNFLKSKWANEELSIFLKESHKRKISIIPIIIEKSSIPSNLLDYDIINLSTNFENGLEKIIRKLKVIPEIYFDHFTGNEFEKLISDLLKEYGFKNVQENRIIKGTHVDFLAEFESKSPFGITFKEKWLIETKFYKQERFSINAIKTLIDYKNQLLPADLKLLLVTNSILTSVAQQYLDDYQNIENTQIQVIDGVQLKQLISNRKRLLDKYFKI